MESKGQGEAIQEFLDKKHGFPVDKSIDDATKNLTFRFK